MFTVYVQEVPGAIRSRNKKFRHGQPGAGYLQYMQYVSHKDTCTCMHEHTVSSVIKFLDDGT